MFAGVRLRDWAGSAPPGCGPLTFMGKVDGVWAGIRPRTGQVVACGSSVPPGRPKIVLGIGFLPLWGLLPRGEDRQEDRH